MTGIDTRYVWGTAGCVPGGGRATADEGNGATESGVVSIVLLLHGSMATRADGPTLRMGTGPPHSFQDGLALCAIIEHYVPDRISTNGRSKVRRRL